MRPHVITHSLKPPTTGKKPSHFLSVVCTEATIVLSHLYSDTILSFCSRSFHKAETKTKHVAYKRHTMQTASSRN